MTTIRCTENDFDNTRMTAAGYEIIAVETCRWDDGHTETEILWGKEEQSISRARCRSEHRSPGRVHSGPASRLYATGGPVVPRRAIVPSMNIALRKPRMTREEFLDWAEAQDVRYEFDGFQPVAMQGGSINHNQITLNIHRALYARLKGSGCKPLGPDAGVATIAESVRYPDALVTCTKAPGTDRLVPGVAAAFEVVSPGNAWLDRIVKVREYLAVPSIRFYVIAEQESIGLTVLERREDNTWMAVTLTADDTLRLRSPDIEIPVPELYEDVDLTRADNQDSTAAAQT